MGQSVRESRSLLSRRTGRTDSCDGPSASAVSPTVHFGNVGKLVEVRHAMDSVSMKRLLRRGAYQIWPWVRALLCVDIQVYTL